MCCVEVSRRERIKMKESVMLIPFLLRFFFLCARISFSSVKIFLSVLDFL